MPYVSAFDYYSQGGVAPSVTVGSGTNLDNMKTNKLTEVATLTTTGAPPLGEGSCTLRFTGGAMGSFQMGCIYIGGLDFGVVTEIEIKLQSSGGTTWVTDTLSISSEVLGFNPNFDTKYGVYYWFNSQSLPSFGRVEITFKRLGDADFDVGRIWIGNGKSVQFDAGWQHRGESNSGINRTVGGAADITVRAAFRELRIKSSGAHLGSSYSDIFRIAPNIVYNDLKWSDIDALANLYQEMVICWKDVDTANNPNSSLTFFSTQAFSMYCFPKITSGIKHISGPNYELSWTLQEHL